MFRKDQHNDEELKMGEVAIGVCDACIARCIRYELKRRGDKHKTHKQTSWHNKEESKTLYYEDYFTLTTFIAVIIPEQH